MNAFFNFPDSQSTYRTRWNSLSIWVTSTEPSCIHHAPSSVQFLTPVSGQKEETFTTAKFSFTMSKRSCFTWLLQFEWSSLHQAQHGLYCRSRPETCSLSNADEKSSSANSFWSESGSRARVLQCDVLWKSSSHAKDVATLRCWLRKGDDKLWLIDIWNMSKNDPISMIFNPESYENSR